jgi:peptidyl-dipeptidase Dcp
MKQSFRNVYTFIVLLTVIMSCAPSDTQKTTALVTDNPLLQEWKGQYGGVPQLDSMNLKYLPEALDKAMEVSLANYDAVANDDDDATFENTIIPMEKADEILNRVFAYYGLWSNNLSSPEFRKIQDEYAPKLSDFSNKITQNEKLFARVKAVYDASQKSKLLPEQQRLVQLIYEDFAMSGAALDAEKKKRYADIEKELSLLYNKFSNNVLADEENYVTYLNKNEIGGLPDDLVKAAAKAASDRGKDGMYAITNTRSSVDPFLTYSTNRPMREKVWKIFTQRGDNGDSTDNNAVITQILKLRDERVALMDFENYAQWRLQNRMAKNPENAMNMMKAVWPAAVGRVKEEVADMQAIASTDKITIEPWDYRYYAEKVRKKKYDLDSDEVKQYLQLDKLQEAMFFVAGELFNFNFKPVPEGTVPVFHEDVNVWEVTNKTSGDHVGLWYLDPYARQGKRSGAWANSFRYYSSFDGEKTVLSTNNSNFVKPAPGEPLLISWDDAKTFFHEFGHALHMLSANVKYPTLNGGVRDYTEFHSQLLERWLITDPVINQYFVHYQTGKPMPKELVEKIKKAATFNQGFITTEYLSSALMDMYFHTTDPNNLDPDKFEKETLTSLGMPKELVMRHRSPHFTHVFAGEGYATGYYGYMWADVLTSDAAEMFAQAPNGYYDKELAAKMVKYLFAPRNAMDPAEAYRLFRGRDAKIEALMKDRGFPVSN